MYMRPTTKLSMFAAILTLCSGMMLTSCSETDNPVIEPLAVDHGTWIDEASDMDPTVSPGDNFFMYCNGNWWKNTDLGDKQVTGFLRGTVADILKKRVDALDLPSLSVMKRHAPTFSPDEGEDAKVIDELLRPVMEATTLEEAWFETGRMMARGGTFGMVPQAISVEGVIHYFMSIELTLMFYTQGDDADWKRYDAGHNPDLLARLVPITTGSSTRSVESSGQWPMLVAWFRGIGIDPAYALTEVESNRIGSGQEIEGLLSQNFKELQEKDLESYKQGIATSVRSTIKGLLNGEKSELANQVYTKLARYESSRAMVEKYVTDDMRERTLSVCHDIRDTFADRIRRSQWLDEGSKAAALDKLYNMSFNVGGPKEWIEEGFADLSESKCFMEDVRLLFQARLNILKKLAGQKVSDNAFHLLTATTASLTELNSSYSQQYNAMFIYPVFMMDPVWPDNANEALVYAAATTIGHEITHGFDALGYKYNKYGSYGPIFASEEDNTRFQALTQQMKDWYSSLEVMPDELPGVCNNGEWTLTENIADLGGFEIAYEAYCNKLKKDGFSGAELRRQQQRFYQAYAYTWKTKYTAEYAKTRTLGTNEYGQGADGHSLDKERVNGVVPNTDAWYDLFDVKPGQKFYRSPKERIHIW